MSLWHGRYKKLYKNYKNKHSNVINRLRVRKWTPRSVKKKIAKFYIAMIQLTPQLPRFVWYWMNATNYWTFQLWVRTRCVNSAENLNFVLSGSKDDPSVSTIWCWCCAFSLQLYQNWDYATVASLSLLNGCI